MVVGAAPCRSVTASAWAASKRASDGHASRAQRPPDDATPAGEKDKIGRPCECMVKTVGFVSGCVLSTCHFRLRVAWGREKRRNNKQEARGSANTT